MSVNQARVDEGLAFIMDMINPEDKSEIACDEFTALISDSPTYLIAMVGLLASRVKDLTDAKPL